MIVNKFNKNFESQKKYGNIHLEPKMKKKTKKKKLKNKTRPFAILIVLLCTLLTSLGQLFLKFGANKLSLSFYAIIMNYNLIIGCFFYGMGAILLIVALKYGELSVLYPFIALSFIWVSILSMIFLSEIMTTGKWVGIAVIVVGVSLIGWGANHD
ncbi:EamA family transporter [Nanoarchaeota archaeon]